MKTFKKHITEEELNQAVQEAEKEKKAAPEEAPADEPTPKEEPADAVDSEIGEWIKAGGGWNIHFKAGSKRYTLAISPTDDGKELHWKFTYYLFGQRTSSDIKKFGPISEWSEIWTVIFEILKDFLRLFRPISARYIGMSISKRQIYYREFYKMYEKNFRFVFRSLGYYTSFDYRNLNQAPVFVVAKGKPKNIEDKKTDTKEETVQDVKVVVKEEDVKYKVVSTHADRKVSVGDWVQPAQYRQKGDDGKYFRVKVEFTDPKVNQSATRNFKDREEGLKWAAEAKPSPGMPDSYVKQFGTAAE